LAAAALEASVQVLIQKLVEELLRNMQKRSLKCFADLTWCSLQQVKVEELEPVPLL
jgi:hypothetical protein